MLVVADSSPVHSLIEIGQTGILPILFERVVVPTQVAGELSHPHAPELVRKFIQSPPTWLEISTPRHVENIPGLDLGEQAAIGLAQELHPEYLLIDERQGREAAASRGIPIIGTVGILEGAARQKLLDLEKAFADLRKTRFRFSESLLDAAIARVRGETER